MDGFSDVQDVLGFSNDATHDDLAILAWRAFNALLSPPRTIGVNVFKSFGPQIGVASSLGVSRGQGMSVALLGGNISPSKSPKAL